MTTQKTLLLEGKDDSCTLRFLADGSLLIGSIRLKPDEIEDFPGHLRDAIAELSRINPKKTETV